MKYITFALCLVFTGSAIALTFNFDNDNNGSNKPYFLTMSNDQSNIAKEEIRATVSNVLIS